MPVALATHIDRSPVEILLRGRVGQIHLWMFNDNESSAIEDGVHVLSNLPKVVFVQFKGARGAPLPQKLEVAYPAKHLLDSYFSL